MIARIKILPSFILLPAIIIIFLGGCKVGPNFKSVDPDLPSRYRFDSLETASTDSLLNIKWWDIFEDPVLDTLIATGLHENKNVLIAMSRIEQSKTVVGITKADYWPQFGYSAGFIRGNVIAGVPTGGDASSVYTGFGSLNWEIDFWGKFRRANEAARAELAASEFGLRTTQVGLISQISGTYFLLLDYKWRLEISRKTLELREASLQIIQARFDKGIVAEIDLNQAQIQRAIAAAAVPFYERKVAQTENALGILLGRNPGPITTGAELQNFPVPPDIPPGIPSTLLQRRPDIIRSRELAHAQTARIGVAVAQRFPSISLTGVLGVASTELSSLTANAPAWQVGGSLLGPLLQFGKNKRRVELETQKAEQAVREYELTVITAFQEVEDALIEIETLNDEILARQDHVAAATNARSLSKERYDKGVTSYLELLESERQMFEAELRLSETTQQLFNGYTKLYKALGGGWISVEEMNNTLNPPPSN